MEIEPVAVLHSPFKEKFGIPRQSGVVDDVISEVRFLDGYRNPDFICGLEHFSHIWLIWGFSANKVQTNIQAKVRPPRLGGNSSLGVFATRSPYRPNPLGLSCVKIESIDTRNMVIKVRGADLLDGTPVFDIKPYIPYADSRPEAKGGFTDDTPWAELDVDVPEDVSRDIPADILSALVQVLKQDPRPRYQDDPERIYGLSFDSFNVRFKVSGSKVLVLEISRSRI